VKRLRLAQVISAGHAFVQNLRRGHYGLGLDIDRRHRLTAIFEGIRPRHLARGGVPENLVCFPPITTVAPSTIITGSSVAVLAPHVSRGSAY
jgi:hypothetical protein